MWDRKEFVGVGKAGMRDRRETSHLGQVSKVGEDEFVNILACDYHNSAPSHITSVTLE